MVIIIITCDGKREWPPPPVIIRCVVLDRISRKTRTTVKIFTIIWYINNNKSIAPPLIDLILRKDDRNSLKIKVNKNNQRSEIESPSPFLNTNTFLFFVLDMKPVEHRQNNGYLLIVSRSHSFRRWWPHP